MKKSIFWPSLAVCLVVLLIFSGFNIPHPTSGPETDPIKQAEDSLIGKSKHWLALQGMVRISTGDIKTQHPALDSAQVFVKNENDSIVLGGLTDHKGRLAFRLPLNRTFTIHITKPGFVEKKVLVATSIPAGSEKVASFTFDIDIFPSVKGLDVSVLEKPISKINYRPYTGEFVYDATYTHKINGELNKMYRDYFAIQKATNDSINGVSKTKPPVKKKKK
jgi:hypothetical protein